MIDIKKVLKDLESMRANIKARGLSIDLDNILLKYNHLIDLQKSLELLQYESNDIAKRVGLFPSERKKLCRDGSKLKIKIAETKGNLERLESDFNLCALKLPNWIHSDVPVGESECDNQVVSSFMGPSRFNFIPKDHIQLGKHLDLIDFESGTKVAGTRFYFLKNEAVLLQHAIKSFVFRKAIEAGFTPLHTPDIAKNSILQGIGFSPRGISNNTYQLADLESSLIATAEISVGGIHSKEVLEEIKLPILYVAESHCFRREAGAAGKYDKGLYRVHQFEKIELFAICTPNQSDAIHQKIVKLEESIYQDLKIPYRVILNCSGDLGLPAYKKYDIEAWMPGKGETGEYGEITSASNCTDFQARRLGIKYKDAITGKNFYAHTLNGTASALGRTMIAILENYQTAEGGINIPVALRPYLGFNFVKPRHLT